MIYLLDTNILINICRYYLCYDQKEVFKKQIIAAAENDHIRILQSVKGELINIVNQNTEDLGFISFLFDQEVFDKKLFCEDNAEKYFSGIPDERLRPFLANFNVKFLTDHANALLKKDPSFNLEVQKKMFFGNADFKLVVYAMYLDGLGMKSIIVSDESRKNNDMKYFVKLPVICDSEKIEIINLPKFMREVWKHITIQIDTVEAPATASTIGKVQHA
jgi:hypothetical protein